MRTTEKGVRGVRNQDCWSIVMEFIKHYGIIGESNESKPRPREASAGVKSSKIAIPNTKLIQQYSLIGALFHKRPCGIESLLLLILHVYLPAGIWELSLPGPWAAGQLRRLRKRYSLPLANDMEEPSWSVSYCPKTGQLVPWPKELNTHIRARTLTVCPLLILSLLTW